MLLIERRRYWKGDLRDKNRRRLGFEFGYVKFKMELLMGSWL